MKGSTTKIEYPLYNVCFKMKNGEEKIVRKEVSLQQALASIRKFDRILVTQRSEVKDVHYCFLVPLMNKIPYYDAEKQKICYLSKQYHPFF